eukprot:scaffold40630_cov70-Attheya_sp.AAC.1
MFNRVSMGSGMSPANTAGNMCKLHTPVVAAVTSFTYWQVDEPNTTSSHPLDDTAQNRMGDIQY